VQHVAERPGEERGQPLAARGQQRLGPVADLAVVGQHPHGHYLEPLAPVVGDLLVGL
jgi:hypothetical protein